MHSSTNLDISGYRDQPVPHTFLRQDEGADHLGILLPGVAYGCDLPLLYYPSRLLLALGADVLRVEYAYSTRQDYATLPVDGRAEWLFADVGAACRAGLAQRPYRRITLVGKSLGTLAMGHLLAAGAVPAETSAVWLTPLLRTAPLRAQMGQYRRRSLFVIGTADPYYDPALLAEVERATDGAFVVVEGADHSMELPGDVVGSLGALTRVMQALVAFLS